MLRRRALLTAGIGGAVLCQSPLAQPVPDWPGRPIRIVVGYPAGQTADLNARQFAAALARELASPVIVDNRPGANALIAAQEVIRSQPDGYTLFWGGSGPLAINPALYRKSYDSLKDFTPISLANFGALILVAHPSFEDATLAQLIAHARSVPGKVDYATGGNGSTAHLAMKLFESDAKIALNHVPYKGSPAALNDVLGGQIPLMLEPVLTTLPYIHTGKLKALGVTSLQRSPVLPGIPTFAEQGVLGFDVVAWNSLVAPRGLPPALGERLAQAMRNAVNSPAIAEAMRASGQQASWLGPSEYAEFQRKEVVKWARAVALSGARID